ncbi:MAG: MFS transporter [Chloroflexota bacterium]
MSHNTVVQPRSMRTFMTIWVGQLISILGSGLTNFGLAVWIFQETGEATPFALTVLFGSVPRILLAPIAGAVVDRWNRRWVMIISDTVNVLLTIAAILLFASGQLAIWHIYLLAAVTAVLQAFQEPAYTASVTMLVPKEELGRANGLVQMGQALGMLVSPLLAGILFGVVGLRGIFLIDFISYFFAIAALLFVHIPQPERSQNATDEEAKASLWQDALFGWHYLRERTGLFNLLLFFALVNFCLNFAAVLLGPLVLSFATPTAFGTIQAVGGVGMLVGSIVMSSWGGPKGRVVPAVIGFIGVAAIGLTIAGLQASAWVVGLGLFVLMFSVPLGGGISQTIFQRKVAADVQGRVFAIRGMISQSAMPLAFLLAGPLADQIFEPLFLEGGAWSNTFFGSGAGRGIGFLLVSSGLILLVATIIVFLNPRVRHLEDELPDVLPDDIDDAEADVMEAGTAVHQPA